MKITKAIATLIMCFIIGTVISQENKVDKKEETKESYYKKRGMEDAKFEKDYKANTKKEERKFWRDQKAYEKELKTKDEIAYEAYMKGKKDAYLEQRNNCNTHHCSHSYYYHNHADFYYHYEYRSQRRNRTNTNIRVGLPSVRVGLF